MMRTLMWKEWRENKLLLFGGAVFVVVVAAIAVNIWSIWDATDIAMLLQYLVIMWAVIIGSSLVASEVGAGTIIELASRPVHPWKVWLSKCVVGLAATYVVFVVAQVAAYGAVLWEGWEWNFKLMSIGIAEEPPLPFSVLVPGVAFGAAFFVSTLCSQSMVSALGSIVPLALLTGYWFLWRSLFTWPGHFDHLFGSKKLEHLILLVGASTGICTFLAVSILVYLKGHIESGLRGPKWRVACISAGVVIGIGMLILILAGVFEDWMWSVWPDDTGPYPVL